MAAHDYTPQEALDTLMRKLHDRDATLASHVREVIDAGKEVLEHETRRKRRRAYRLRVAFTPEEALQAALTSLEAYFIEQPRCINSALDELSKVGMSREPLPKSSGTSPPARRALPESVGVEKDAAIELRAETQIATASETPGTFGLKRTPEELIQEENDNLARLREMLDFRGE